MNPKTREELKYLLELGLNKKVYPEELRQGLRYVIYARKSTDDPKKQQRTLSDQITECKEYAERHVLNVVEIISESRSGREPGIRPEFQRMINNLMLGKIDGIISWATDRISRNMKDAGEVIDLLDKDIIKDLRFVTFPFTNTPAGKMLLGFQFVMAKEYSDKLSEDVQRGNRRSAQEGKSLNPKAKHGYYKDQFLRLIPDPNSFNLLISAWKMRLNGVAMETIAKYLNENSYMKRNKEGEKPKLFHMTKQILSDIFRNPVYCGLSLYGEKVYDLVDIYNFIPMVSVEDFMKINDLKDLSPHFLQKLRGEKRSDINAKFLNRKVFCGYCNKRMSAGVTTKKTTSGKAINYFYFRCDTKGCHFKNKSTRANVVYQHALSVLENSNFNYEKMFEFYKEKMKEERKNKNAQLISKRTSIQNQHRHEKSNFEKAKSYVLNEEDEALKNIFRSELAQKQELLKKYEKEIKEIQKEIDTNKVVELSFSKFLELFKDIPNRIRNSKSLEEKDFYLSKIFLNWVLKDRKVFEYKLNKPFDSLLDENVVSGRGERTRTSGLLVPNQAL